MPVIVSRLPRKVKTEISKVLGLPAPGKYGNVRVKLDGITFDSLKERDRYLVLLMRQKLGEISGLEVHPRFKLLDGGNGERVVSYVGDFSYYTNQGFIFVVEDVKARITRTAVYRLKRKLMKKIYGIDIKEVM